MYNQLVYSKKIDTFRCTHHPYYIFSLNYTQKSAGLRSYYYLCHILNELGYEAYVVADEPVVGLRTPVLTYAIRQKHIKEGRHPITVYGETTQGNPLRGDVIVRWMLNKVGRIGANVTFNGDDLLFYWDSSFSGVDNPNILKVPILDSEIFNCGDVDESQRSGYCFYANKYFYFDKGKISDKVRGGGVNITTENALTHQEIAGVLRKSKVLFSYEETATGGEAALCGCTLVYVLTKYNRHLEPRLRTGQSRIELVNEEDIDFTLPYYNPKETLARAKEQYVELDNEQFNVFISETQHAADVSSANTAEDEFLRFCEVNEGRIYIYGTGMLSPQCHQTLCGLGVQVRGFVVSDGMNDGLNHYRGLPVTRLSKMEINANTAALILAMTLAHEEEVIPLLEKLGFDNYIRYPLLTK